MKTKMRLPTGHSKSSRQRMDLQKDGVYQLKVVLALSRPSIWRRVLVPGNYTLAILHDVVQCLMGWEDCHLHEFVVGNARYGPAARRDDLFAPDIEDEKRAILKEIMTGARKSFKYIYDFGDDWIHEIKLEKILLPEAGKTYPLCVGGENACPPEDIGGIFGYYEQLEILKDRAHPEHKEVKEWMGRFDPASFSIEAVNQSLRAFFRKPAR